jgi:hypothetical protein
MAATDREIMLKGVTLSFPALFTPKVYENKNPDGSTSYSYSYEANLILDENHPQVDQIKEAIRGSITDKWPSNAPTIPVDRRPLRSGMIEDPDTGERKARWDGYDGKLFVSCSRKVKSPNEPNPVQLIDGVRGPDGKFVRLTEADGKLYAGAKVNAIIRIYAYDGARHGNPHRINASIEAVQFAGHGEAFGAKPVDVEDKFSEVAGLMEDGFDEGSSGGTSGATGADDLL